MFHALNQTQLYRIIYYLYCSSWEVLSCLSVVVLCVQEQLSGRIVKVRFGLSCLGGQNDNKSIVEEKFASSVSAFFMLLLFCCTLHKRDIR